MQINEWESRWQDGRIGFHLPEVNPYLLRHADILLKSENSGPERPVRGENQRSVFVPLCGKTLDLLWLAQQTEKVVGVELIQKAVEAFYEENEIAHSIHNAGQLQFYCNGSVDIFQGNFFDLGLGHTRPFEAVYDRGALVAVAQSERQKYVNHLMSFLVSGGRMLLITLEYDQSKMSGPPYSVPDEEVQTLFAQYGSLKCLETQEILEERFRKKGLDKMLERVYQFVRN